MGKNSQNRAEPRDTIVAVVSYVVEIAPPDGMTATQLKSSLDVIAPACMMLYLEYSVRDTGYIWHRAVMAEQLDSPLLLDSTEIAHGPVAQTK